MKAFFDTEFTGLHQKTTLISLGIVCKDEFYFYAEFTDYDKTQVDDWIRDNVIKNLLIPEDIVGTSYEDKTITIRDNTENIRKELIKVFKQKGSSTNKIEMWSDCLAYDWILFNNIFGTAFDLPEEIYYIPFDICTLFKMKGIDPDISREQFAKIDPHFQMKHNSLYDAITIKACYDKLIKM